MSFRDLQTTADVLAWIDRLNADRPERTEVIQHIVTQVEALPFPELHVVELCPGAGLLAEALLTAAPQIQYTGIDFLELLINFSRDRLTPFGDRATLIQADLNKNGWMGQFPQGVHAIISMQSLHDLGGEPEVNRIYGLAQTMLKPGGLFLNADLVVPPDADKPDNPGRRSIPRHLELLRSHGYGRVSCSLEKGEFGCCVAFKA